MERYTRDNGLEMSSMDLVYKFGLMAHDMKDIGNIIKLVEKVNSGTWTETFLKENGKMTRQMVMGYTYT